MKQVKRGRPRVHVVPAVPMPTGVKVVLAGVDTIWVSLQGQVPDELATYLDGCKERAQSVGQAVPSDFLFEEQTLYVEPYGAQFWRWVLRCPSLMLDVGVGQHAPLCRAQLASEYLWQVGPERALAAVEDLLRWLFGPEMKSTLSELHLCVDVAGVTPAMLAERGLVGRSRRGRKHVPEEGDETAVLPAGDVQHWCRKTTGYSLSWGSPQSCAIYDKVLEIKQQSPDKVWFFDLWEAGGWDRRSPVTRIEFRYKREVLREMGLLDPHEALTRLADLWTYSTSVWLRYCVPTGDPNRARWPVHPVWEIVQQADFGGVPTCPVVRVRKRQVALDRAVATVAGYLSSSAAWLGGPYAEAQTDISVVLRWFCERAEQYYAERGVEFSSVVLDKRQRFGLARGSGKAA